MYTYVSSIVRFKDTARAWLEQDLENMTLKEIVKNYSDVYFTFTHTTLPGWRYCFLEDLLSTVMRHDIPLYQALIDVGSRVIPTSPMSKEIIRRTAIFADALQAGWTYKTVKPNTHPDTDAIASERKDLFLSKEGIDLDVASKSLVGFVNGMAHYTAVGYGGVILINGGQTMRDSDKNLVSFLNLGKLGDVEFVNITENNLSPGLNLTKDETVDGYISLNKDLTNKTVIFSIGGILHYEGNIVKVTNREQGVFKFNYHLMNHPVWLYDVAKQINPAALGTLMTNIRANILLRSAVFDIGNLKAIMNMPQTFAIIVDTPNVLLEYSPVKDMRVSNGLMAYEWLSKAIIGYSGRLLPYRVKDNGGRYMYHVDEIQKPTFTHWTQTSLNTEDQITIGTFLPSDRETEHNQFVNIITQEFIDPPVGG